MKDDNIRKLISLLGDTSHHLSSEELGNLLHVDKRTIRNYIKEINSSYPVRIESNVKGYRLIRSAPTVSSSSSEQEERVWQVLGELLTSNDGVSLFDLAVTMHVSESTILRNISVNLKDLLEQYQLRIISHDYYLTIEGEEYQKRKLIGYVISHRNTQYFTADETLNKLIPNTDANGIRKIISEYCRTSGLSINSYALNNLLIHLAVILARIESDNTLTNTSPAPDAVLNQNLQKDQILKFAELINDYCIEKTGKSIPENDYSQILLLTALNSDRMNEDMQFDAFINYVDPKFFNLVINIILDLNRRYDLPQPDNRFLMQFTLHVYNLYQRSSYNIGYPNPLREQIKREYAPVYDMAVYFSLRLSESCNISISEDEIAFIAFHLGSWIENYQHEENRVPFLVVTNDYYQMSKALIHRIHMSLGDRLHHLGTVTLDDYMQNQYPADLVITTIKAPMAARHVVTVSPIISNKDLQKIEDELNRIINEQKSIQTLTFMKQMFNEDLYARNISIKSGSECLQYLCTECLNRGLIDQSFIIDVQRREHASSTAFTDYLAIPHTMSVYARKSFVYVLHNDRPISWNGTHVNFVLLIGIAEGDMKQFRSVFDRIVESFSSVDQTKRLLASDTFTEFFNVLAEI